MPSTHRRNEGQSAIGLVPSAVTTATERRMSSGHWLLASAPDIRKAHAQWRGEGETWLRPGALFTAVMISAAVIHAAVGDALTHAKRGSIHVIVTRLSDSVVQLSVVDLAHELPGRRMSGEGDESGQGWPSSRH